MSMETVKVSKKYQIIIPEKLREEAGIVPGDELVAILKHKILHFIPMRSMKASKGMTPGLDIMDLRDESEE